MSVKSSLDRLKQRMKTAQPAADAGAESDAAPARRIPFQKAFNDVSLFPEYKEFTTMEWFYKKQNFTWNQFLTHMGSSDAIVNLEGREVINFSSYNYLALACDDRVKAAAKNRLQWIRNWP